MLATDKRTTLSSKSEILDLITLKVVIYVARECRLISLVDGFCQAFSGHLRGIQETIPSASIDNPHCLIYDCRDVKSNS